MQMGSSESYTQPNEQKESGLLSPISTPMDTAPWRPSVEMPIVKPSRSDDLEQEEARKTDEREREGIDQEEQERLQRAWALEFVKVLFYVVAHMTPLCDGRK